MIDPISDMLTRIRNAVKTGHQTVKVPMSKLKLELAKILQREGFIDYVEQKSKTQKKYLDIGLKYKDNIPAIRDLRRISKPGQRIYINKNEIRPVKQGYGIAIISTSKGLMTDKEARKQKIGGEIICEVW